MFSPYQPNFCYESDYKCICIMINGKTCSVPLIILSSVYHFICITRKVWNKECHNKPLLETTFLLLSQVIVQKEYSIKLEPSLTQLQTFSTSSPTNNRPVTLETIAVTGTASCKKIDFGFLNHDSYFSV